MRAPSIVLPLAAALIAACGSSAAPLEPLLGTCDGGGSVCSALDAGGDANATVAPNKGSPPPVSVDGGISAPCHTTADCSYPLTCIDGACFD